mmetsp:Transcript_23637/g.36877  ORF Transcript_23637/g.36877 Transcript_23637/m.36877 type:complete len:295 (+) Transcript_23637:39-923(+)
MTRLHLQESEGSPLQVAGHGDMECALGGLVILKKNRGFELDNYCRFFHTMDGREKLASFLPRFLGAIVQEKGPPMFYSPTEIFSRPSVKDYRHSAVICLENLIAYYEDPCVVDVKIGKIFFNKLTDAAKVARCTEKSQKRSVEKLGVIVCGASHWPGAREVSEECCSIEDLASVLMRCLDISSDQNILYQRALSLSLVEDMLQQLMEIRSATLPISNEFSFISTSILLAYDKSMPLDTRADRFCRYVSVKLIDFSNCVSKSPHGFCDSRIGYHEGLQNLVDSFKTMHRRISGNT